MLRLSLLLKICEAPNEASGVVDSACLGFVIGRERGIRILATRSDWLLAFVNRSLDGPSPVGAMLREVNREGVITKVITVHNRPVRHTIPFSVSFSSKHSIP